MATPPDSKDFKDSNDRDKTEIRDLTQDVDAYPCLEVVNGPQGRGRYVLSKGKNLLGRSPECEISLDDSSVSRRHAIFESTSSGEEGGVSVADLGSRNGIKVNGRKISQPTLLKHKDTVKTGVYEFRFLTRPESAAEPVAEVSEIAESEPSPAPSPLAASASVDIAPSRSDVLPVSFSGGSDSGTPGSSGFKKLVILAVVVGLVAAAAFLGWRYVRPMIAVWWSPDSPTEPIKKGEPKPGKPGQIGGVLPAETLPMAPKTAATSPYFLDISASPLPARVFFADASIGITPLKTSVNLEAGKSYEARALFQLPEIGEVVEEKAQFSPAAGESVIPVNFSGRIGVFKISGLPRDAQLYLEGYFEKDPYRAKPIKFAEIVFGKPIYVPFGRYVLELRRSRRLGDSQTFLDEVVYRREFKVEESQTSYTVDVADDALKSFPVELTSVPPLAKVFIDEKEVGTTPYQGVFPVGEHLLTLKREGYFDFVQIIKMNINTPYVAEIPLKTSAAGEFINKADALMKEGRYSEALPILIDAFTKVPSEKETAQISYLIGACYLQQKSYKDAQDYFLKAMVHADYQYAGRLGVATVTYEQGDPLRALQLLVEVLINAQNPTQDAALEPQIAKVRADAGSLFQKISPLKSVIYVASEPAGARVFVNSTEIEQRTPMILHDMGVGSYKIQFRKEGYADEEVKLNLGVSEFRPVIAKMRPQ